MGWLLRFNDTTDYVSLPSSIENSNLGTSNWSFEFKGSIRALPSSGRQGILGTVNSSFANGFSISNLGQLQITYGGNVIISTVADFLILNEVHTYKVSHLTTGNVTFQRDGINVDGAFYNSTSDWTSTRRLSRFGIESGGNTVSPAIDIEYVELIGFTNGQKWDANLSGGTGTNFQTVSGSNQGSFLGTPVWVGYTPPSTSKPLKYWNGSAWVTKPLKYWNGSAWVEKPLKYHNGTSWS